MKPFKCYAWKYLKTKASLHSLSLSAKPLSGSLILTLFFWVTTWNDCSPSQDSIGSVLGRMSLRRGQECIWDNALGGNNSLPPCTTMQEWPGFPFPVLSGYLFSCCHFFFSQMITLKMRRRTWNIFCIFLPRHHPFWLLKYKLREKH